jgi:hypothetical protein
MNKIFRKGCQVGCLFIILLGIFIWAAISLESYVGVFNRYGFNSTNANNYEFSIDVDGHYQAEWFRYYQGNPYTFDITASPLQDTSVFIGMRYVKFINKTRPGMTIEINTEFMKIFKNEGKMTFRLNEVAIPYDDYDVIIGYTYEENGATKDGETSLELKREPSITRGNYFIDAMMSV